MRSRGLERQRRKAMHAVQCAWVQCRAQRPLPTPLLKVAPFELPQTAVLFCLQVCAANRVQAPPSQGPRS